MPALLGLIQPYVARLAAGLVCCLAVLLGCLYVRELQHRLDIATRNAADYRSRAERAEKSGKLAVRLMADSAAAARERADRISTLEGRIRDAKKPLPKECDAALDPLRVALDGLRNLQAVPATPAAGLPSASSGAAGRDR